MLAEAEPFAMVPAGADRPGLVARRQLSCECPHRGGNNSAGLGGREILPRSQQLPAWPRQRYYQRIENCGTVGRGFDLGGEHFGHLESLKIVTLGKLGLDHFGTCCMHRRRSQRLTSPQVARAIVLVGR